GRPTSPPASMPTHRSGRALDPLLSRLVGGVLRRGLVLLEINLEWAINPQCESLRRSVLASPASSRPRRARPAHRTQSGSPPPRPRRCLPHAAHFSPIHRPPLVSAPSHLEWPEPSLGCLRGTRRWRVFRTIGRCRR